MTAHYIEGAGSTLLQFPDTEDQ